MPRDCYNPRVLGVDEAAVDMEASQPCKEEEEEEEERPPSRTPKACFVCLENTNENERSCCHCGVPVHNACLLKVVHTKRTTACVICKKPISNAHAVPTRAVQCNTLVLTKSALFVGGLILCALSAKFFVTACLSPLDCQVRVALAFVFAVSALVSLWLFAHVHVRFGEHARAIVKRDTYRVGPLLV